MSNLMHTIKQHDIDLVFAQEPYVIENKVTGVSRNYRTFINGNHRIRTAILVTNEHINAIQVNQISDEDDVVTKLIHGSLRVYAARMYLDIKRDINIDFTRVDNISSLASGNGLIIGMDSNTRSKAWHDIIKKRARKIS